MRTIIIRNSSPINSYGGSNRKKPSKTSISTLSPNSPQIQWISFFDNSDKFITQDQNSHQHYIRNKSKTIKGNKELKNTLSTIHQLSNKGFKLNKKQIRQEKQRSHSSLTMYNKNSVNDLSDAYQSLIKYEQHEHSSHKKSQVFDDPDMFFKKSRMGRLQSQNLPYFLKERCTSELKKDYEQFRVKDVKKAQNYYQQFQFQMESIPKRKKSKSSYNDQNILKGYEDFVNQNSKIINSLKRTNLPQNKKQRLASRLFNTHIMIKGKIYHK